MRQRNLPLFLFAATLFLASCGSTVSDQSAPNTHAGAENEKPDTTKRTSSESIIDIRLLAGKSLAQVEKVLGKSEVVEKVKGYPCKNTDCQRAYFKKGAYEIIFKKSKADRITINNVPDLTRDESAIQALGLPASKPTFKNPNTIIRWNEVGGLYEVGFYTDYVLVQVTKPE